MPDEFRPDLVVEALASENARLYQQVADLTARLEQAEERASMTLTLLHQVQAALIAFTENTVRRNDAYRDLLRRAK